MKKLLLAVSACLLLASCGPKEEDRNTLVVGMELAYPPFEMTDESGKPTGVSVDLAHALGKKLNRPVEIRNMAFDGLIPALKTGSIDLIISSMTATEERAKSIDFSIPYVYTGLAILASSESDISSIKDLNQAGKTVVVKMGTTGHMYATSELPEATIRALDKEDACVLEVSQGKADAFLYDQMSVYRHSRRNPKTTRPLLEAFKREAWAVGIQKGNDELKAEVNDFIDAHRKENGFATLADTYFGDMKTMFSKQGIPFVFDPPAP